MIRVLGVGLWLVWTLGGCAAFGFAPPEPEPDEGDPHGPPALSVLPPLDPETGAATQGVRQAMLETRDVLERRLPEPPVDRSHRVLAGWVETRVAAWIREHEEQVADVRARLSLEGPPSAGERVVGYALEGLMYEHLALELARMPSPRELDSEPEIAVMYRELVDTQARPFVTSALIGYRECANTAHDEAEALMGWGRFCARRFNRLKAEVDDTAEAHDKAEAQHDSHHGAQAHRGTEADHSAVLHDGL